jgi:adenylate cyclase
VPAGSNDIFISYARSSEPQARRIAELLRGVGLSVWWDDDLPVHRSYGDVIEERLRAAKAVLVLWSADATKSQWVRAEADAARNAGTLVQISVDGMMPPLPFNQIQCATLSNWDGDPNAAGWRKVSNSVAELVGKRKPKDAAGPRSAGLSICVLPFANVSNDPEQEYFSDGITEDLILGLSQISALSVVARNTSFTFKDKPVEITALARQLRVSHIVEGSVRKAASRVRITAQLIDATTGHHLWAERFDRELNDVFQIQDEISEAIVSQLKLKLVPGELVRPQHVPDPQAYQATLKARHCWNRGTEASLHEAVALFREAIAHDPNYARPYAGLADACVILGNHTYVEPEAAYAQAREAAEQALSIDPELADAHASLGLIAFVHDWNPAQAERHLRTAVELDSASPMARHHLSRLLSATAKHKDAIAHARAAAETDPLSLAAIVQLATALDLAGQPVEALNVLEKALVLFPGEFRIYYKLVFVFASLGRFEDSLAAADSAVRVGGRTMFSLGALGYANAAAGRIEEARAIAGEMEAAAAERYVCPFDIAAIYSEIADNDAAICWLHKALEMRDHAVLFAAVDPALGKLRGDRRFPHIVQQVWACSSSS